MKQTLYTLLIISAIGLASLSLSSCRKDKFQPNIQQYDSTQIKNYIAAQGLTGMIRDTTGGDTSGIYYQILNPGTQSVNGVPVTPVDYPDKIAFVYTERTFDGTYASSDTIVNHFYDFVGHIAADHFPAGLQIAVHNLLKYPDASIRVLIPSHLAYGKAGTGSGSSQVTNNRIGGNECLDFYVHAVKDYQKYDYTVIQNYMKANNLTGYTMTADSLWYKILTPQTGSDPITDNSILTVTDTGQLFNGTIFDDHNGDNTLTAPALTLIPGVREGLENYASVGTKISLLIPSTLGYGLPGNAAGGIPSFSCIRFAFIINSVSP